ncbi:MAG: hypothetical protein U0167_05430 [bacterium]
MTRAIAVLVLAGRLAVASAARAEFASPETTEVFVGTGAPAVAEVHALAHRFLLDGSDVVRLNGSALAREIDYRLDPDGGILQLAAPLAAGQRLEVSYSWIPLTMPHEIVGLVRGEPTPVDSTHIAAPSTLPAAERIARDLDADLSIDGAKTLAIQAGTNQDATIEQSLRVSVTGRIGQDAKITALLSDQNVPLQPEGNTQRLEELDEVLVKLETKQGAATLGNFVAQRQGTAFGDFDRRLSGAEAWVSRGPVRVRGIGASTRGNFKSLEFRGEAGKQGPYVLAGQGVDPTGVIVAGSERVWLDGRLLTRGESQDYTVDYSRGELEFTNRRLVTQNSKIAVDFEVAEQPYKRSFLLGETSFETPGGAVAWHAAITSERDGDTPRDITLTDDRKAALKAAGDKPVIVPGAVCGVPNGDYREEADHFVWAGTDSGTCEVSFTFVGTGRGDYVRDRDALTGTTFFRFVGAALGDYTPGLSLAAPQALTFADAGVSLGKTDGLSLKAEGAASRDDRNTLSPADDGNNDGAAGQAELSWSSGELAHWGGPVRLKTTGTLRGEAAHFVAPGRTRDAYLGDVWNFADTTRADETVSEVATTLSAAERWSVNGTFGVMDRAGLFQSRRRAGQASWSSPRVPTAQVQVESVRREDDADSLGTVTGDLLRQRANLVTAFGIFRPGVTWWREDREDDRATARLTGTDNAEVGGTLAVAPGSRLQGDVRVARRTSDVVDSGQWVRDAVGRTVEVRAEAPGRRARARLSWIHDVLDYTPGRPSPDQTTDLTRADLSHDSFGGILSGEYTYQTTSKSFTDLLAVPGSPGEPSLALEASARLVLAGAGSRPAAGSSSKTERGPLRWIRAETFARVEEQTTATDRGPIYRLDFSRFQDDEHTIFGEQLVREEVTVLPGGGAFSATGRWERTRTKDARASASPLDLDSERRVVRARNRLSPRFTLESQGTWQEDSRGDARAGTTDFDVRLLELREDLSWQPRPSARLGWNASVVSETDDARVASIRGLLAGVEAQTGVRGAGRLQADVTWTHPLDVRGIDAGQRFRTRNTNELDWHETLEIKASDTIHVSLTYSGRSLQGAPTLHSARAEARALF